MSPEIDASELGEDIKDRKMEKEIKSDVLLEETKERKQFLQVSWRQFAYGCITYLGGNSLGFGFSTLWHKAEKAYFDDYIQTMAMLLPVPLLLGALSIGAPSPSELRRSFGRRTLYSRGNFLCNFPGLDFFAVYMVLALLPMALATHLDGNGSLSSPVLILTKILVGLLLTNIQTAWIHAIITKPSKRSFWERTPGYQGWIHIMPATFFDLTLPICAYYLTKQLLVYLSDLGRFDLTPCPLPLVMELLTSVLTRAIYIRVAASLLPSNEETIIALDPDIQGRDKSNASHHLGIIDAFRSISMQNWHYYRNVIRSVVSLELAFLFPFIVTLGLEFYFERPCTVPELLNLFASMFLA